MRAVEISAPGDPEVLRLCTRPRPDPARGEVLIRIAAAGVNRPDCLQRRGLYPPPPGASDIPGLEAAGSIAALADDVRDFAIGDRVCALLAGGGYAEYCAVPAAQCLPLPAGLDEIQAAALPETFFTVWTNVFQRGQLAAGECILIHGGASGIGTTAIQMASAFGARVYATCGSDEKRRFCERLGAERAINYREEQFAEVVRELRDGRGVNVILDMVGGSYFDDNIGLLEPDGRLVIIAVLGGSRAEINLARIMRGRLTVTGSTLRARSPAHKGRIAGELRERVWPKLEAGELAPVVQATYPLADARLAHELMESNRTMGKLVLIVDGRN
jgi:putative PIG3 family NAD(P)H quinone oxidoreductase